MLSIDNAVLQRPASPNSTRTTLALRSALRNPGRAFVVCGAADCAIRTLYETAVRIFCPSVMTFCPLSDSPK
jgi:hypothetical protein